MRLDQYLEMENDGIGVHDPVRATADALAVLHWHTRIDRNDTKFVPRSTSDWTRLD